ncbi:YkvA family protein [Ketogulonicigenium vulgare]|uniref:Putative transmembrane protein n=1 Tax=Ketogulonicigenium vulgare (strain WSH-001) TaxID=759362 RepID=F9Y747_KETVW|nr:YkvA family protein [Ketogulonicigenium vulgare]ADO41241.1 conserved hypothetical protein [Ketogulonicigenium vulgare Y25]AEM42237.1 putative transmembrane protein [Ketogulonicigenium vulgare WSH-001]ALJ79857.1 hypothetical protein KVH_00810 [Ketogulonicigenium vulgare]ANW32763.1 hypothetical protein KvSKV_00820 [Ketogulonicigenium vulgare]AOZ53070.1 hypothetical protein KVC_0043 [Ketogulonicigenium vulgare]
MWRERLKDFARRLKRDLVALWIAARDRRTPLAARGLAIVVVAYALSPVDLIPDFIPVLGYLDDIILVPLGLALCIRFIPAVLMQDFRALAAARGRVPASRAGLIAVLLIWALLAAWLVSLLF